MTQPISHGYPDYGRYAATSDVLLLERTNENIAALTQYSPFFTGNLQYIMVYTGTNVTRKNVRLMWLDAESGGNTIAEDGLIQESGRVDTLPFPVLGPWLRVIVDLSAYADTHTIKVFSIPTGSSVVNSLGVGTVMIQQPLTVVAGGTIQNVSATRLFAGEATLSTYADGTLCSVHVQIRDLGGTWTTVYISSDVAGGSTRAQIHPVMIPPVPVRAQFHNNNAGNQNFLCGLVGRPLHGGR